MITDEETITQMDAEEAMREASGMFVTAQRTFDKLNSHPDKVSDPKVSIAWWQALDVLYEREKTLWRLFVGNQPTVAQNRLFNQFRDLLLKGSSLKANA